MMKERFTQIRPEDVRYIKLGRKGRWESECIQKGIARIGFDTHKPDVFKHCTDGDWEWVEDYWLKHPKKPRKPAVAANFSGQLQKFFEDQGRILWITFHARRLFWAFLNDAKATADGEGAFRPVKDRWRDRDLSNDELSVDKLPGFVTMLRGFQGTSCNAKRATDIVERINGRRSGEVSEAKETLDRLTEAMIGVVKRLDPCDLELLVDLIFSTSGWRRITRTGNTEKTVDLDLVLPTTGERAFVQVKSKTSQQEFAEYEAVFGKPDGGYSRMFYVYHTGTIQTENDKVSLVDAEKLARMVVEAGLTQWVINKAT